MKINGADVLGDTFAYDGCHKIYICECESDEIEASSIGYEIFPIEVLDKIWDDSCPLKFISNWALDKDYVHQFEDAKFKY